MSDQHPSGIPDHSASPDRGSEASPSGTRAIDVPVRILPLQPDGLLRTRHWLAGRLVAAGDGYVEIDAWSGDVPVSGSFLVALECGEICKHAGMLLVDFEREAANRVRLRGRPGGVVDEILQGDPIMPQFCSQSLTFVYDYPFDLLEQLVGIGVLERSIADHVQVCPQCRGIPTFRPGCPACSSSDVGRDKLIHHFACGYVGFVHEFEDRDELRCPKCLVRHLVVGADFEFTPGILRCYQCNFNGSELVPIAHCLNCNVRFPGRQAILEELICFHAEPLDLLGFQPRSK